MISNAAYVYWHLLSPWPAPSPHPPLAKVSPYIDGSLAQLVTAHHFRRPGLLPLPQPLGKSKAQLPQSTGNFSSFSLAQLVDAHLLQRPGPLALLLLALHLGSPVCLLRLDLALALLLHNIQTTRFKTNSIPRSMQNDDLTRWLAARHKERVMLVSAAAGCCGSPCCLCSPSCPAPVPAPHQLLFLSHAHACPLGGRQLLSVVLNALLNAQLRALGNSRGAWLNLGR